MDSDNGLTTDTALDGFYLNFLVNVDKDGSSLLHIAAQKGHFRLVIYLVKHSADINLVNFWNQTPVELAARNGHFMIVKYLLNNGAASQFVAEPIAYQRQEEMVLPLLSAAADGNLELVEMLIEEGYDANIIGKGGNTALHLALWHYHNEVAKFLINFTNINISNDTDASALQLAVGLGNQALVELLVEQGAEINTPHVENSPIFLCVEKDHLTILKYLIMKGANLNKIDKDGNNVLMQAIRYHRWKIVMELIFSKIDLNVVNKNGKTALSLAIEKKNFSIAHILLIYGVEINAGDSYSKPIHMAACYAKKYFVKFLIEEKKAIIDDGCLYKAADAGNLELVQYFDNLGVNINSGTEEVFSPLFVAAYKGHLAVVRYLTDRGALVNVNQPGSALCVASRFGHSKIVNHLIKLGADVNLADYEDLTPLQAAAREGHFDIIKNLIENGAGVNIPNKSGIVPLRLAAQQGHLEIVEYLIENQADINTPDKEGKTPLQAAAVKGHFDVVKILIENGAGLNIYDNWRAVPLRLAAHNGHLEIVNYLVQKGADANFCNKNKIMPLMAALHNKHKKISDYLDAQNDGRVC